MIGTAAEVLDDFIAGRPGMTRAASVPGGRRVRSDAQPTGNTVLYNYRTEQAIRYADGRIAVTLAKYSVTTSKLVGHLRDALRRAGYAPTGTFDTIHAAVPGRHGGYGIPWHATGWQDVPAEVWAR